METSEDYETVGLSYESYETVVVNGSQSQIEWMNAVRLANCFEREGACISIRGGRVTLQNSSSIDSSHATIGGAISVRDSTFCS
eukprot:7388393-Prymnesium_polylepis.1